MSKNKGANRANPTPKVDSTDEILVVDQPTNGTTDENPAPPHPADEKIETKEEKVARLLAEAKEIAGKVIDQLKILRPDARQPITDRVNEVRKLYKELGWALPKAEKAQAPVITADDVKKAALEMSDEEFAALAALRGQK